MPTPCTDDHLRSWVIRSSGVIIKGFSCRGDGALVWWGVQGEGERLSAIAHGICTSSLECFSHPWLKENLNPSSEWGEAALRGEPLGSYTMNPILDGKASVPAPETC